MNKLFKPIIGVIVLLLIVICSYFLFFKSSGDVLRMQLIPSQNATQMQKSVKILNEVMNEEIKKDSNSKYKKVEVTVGNDYNSAINLLKNNSIQLTTISGGEQSNKYTKLVTATREAMNFDPVDSKSLESKINDEKTLVENYSKNRDYNEDKKSKAKNYRSLIVVKKDSKLSKDIKKQLSEKGSEWTLNWDDYKDVIKTAYKGESSASSYTYFEKWLQKHFKGFNSFVKSLDSKNQFKVSNAVSEQSKKLITNQINIFSTFSGAFSSKAKALDYYNNSKDFDIIGVSEAISNDGIAASKQLSKTQRDYISSLLIKVIHTKKGREGFSPYLYEDFYQEK